MSDYGPSTTSTWGSSAGAGRERGARRKKVFEFVKAANDLRQSYTAQWGTQRGSYSDEYLSTPGSFQDVEIARSGGEEMVIFPSYARRLVGDSMYPRQRRGSTSTLDEYRGISDSKEPGLAGWDEFEDEDAIVAVDVRGWVYAPHRGPMMRKHRLAIALARKLSGIPAPSSPSPDSEDGQPPKVTEKREEEIVDTEAQSIIKRVERGNEFSSKGAILEGSLGEEPGSERPIQRTTTSSSLNPSQLSKDELTIANAHLMERIRPFLTNPKVGMAVTIFFFNDKRSQCRNITTNESGHFSLRASLPFVPTHVRVLASEELSAVKEIEIIEPAGVSLISDIDDTVKHSAIASGAKEIFRNTFIRELDDLTVDGVADWYGQLARLGVDIHYVSNAPWQLYPLLNRYFRTVGLPPGSFHLKQYSGMMQGIFEPTAERKKGSLEQILQDFPERKFILVGDSGEADLEVYTDLVLSNPGRILGIFIRDITTPDRKQFFEKSVDHLENIPSRSRSTPQLVDESDAVVNRPALPPRRPLVPEPAPVPQTNDLIDLRDDEPEKSTPEKLSTPRIPPAVPSKPSALRSVTTSSELPEKPPFSRTETGESIKRKPAPPLPRRRVPTELDARNINESRASHSTPQDSNTKPMDSKQPPPPPPPRRTNTGSSSLSTNTSQINVNRAESQKQPPPPPNPYTLQTRPSWASAPPSVLRSTASNPALSRTPTSSIDNYSSSGTSSPNSSSTPPPPLPNKREELWRRRWERASQIMEDRGVVLGSWRVGKDMQEVSTWLVKEALQNMKKSSGGATATSMKGSNQL